MYFLERREPVSMPNILGGTSQPVPTYRWKAIFFCVEKAPLEDILSKLDRKNYRITTNTEVSQ